ncbi:MAG TPA: WhiB family transcriptional regulator [Candidatus Saccharibacteria bacterium]|nr:WhiB family transcriptional regulator [Candidatus Saccharibacteria bacterium]HRK94077.1 WhiB family transcriptional regulator [Candidatus Saccharibacteria bacterium]
MKQVRIEGGASNEHLSKRVEYANEIFAWLQNPNIEPPEIYAGHKAVLNAAFDGIRPTTIAQRIDSLEDEDQWLGASLAVAGFGTDFITEHFPDLDLDASLEKIGAIQPTGTLAGEVGHNEKSLATLFSLSTEQANEVLIWLRRPYGEAPELNELGGRRLSVVTDHGDLVEAVRTSKELHPSERTIIHLLLAGFDKNMIVGRFAEADVHAAVGALRSRVIKRRAAKAAKAKSAILDFPRTAKRLEKLKDNEDWGKYVVCSPDDDLILEPRRGFEGGVDPRARSLCHSCMVRLHCLKDGLDDDTPVIRGGMSHRERKRLVKFISGDETAEENEQTEEIVA